MKKQEQEKLSVMAQTWLKHKHISIGIKTKSSRWNKSAAFGLCVQKASNNLCKISIALKDEKMIYLIYNRMEVSILMKKILAFFLIACLCIGMVGVNFDNVGVYAVSTNVHHIVTNPAENCSTAMNIGFLAELSYTGCYVQYTTADDTSWANAKTQSGTYKTYGASESSNPFYNVYATSSSNTAYYQTPTFLDYSINLTGLTPDTNYIYRIYDGSAYSATYSFKTAATSGDWSFVVTGDFHQWYNSTRGDNATKAINAAISLASQKGYPAVEHIASVGDIAAHGADYLQWQNIYDLPWIKKYSFANAIGNHDAMNRSGSYKNDWNAIMANYPQNGYSAGLGTCFYYIYNDVLFIYIDYDDTSSAAQSWVDSVCTNMAGQYKYSVLVNHRPATSKTTGKTYSYFWNYWADNCDANKIDLVLAGDHHCYMRTYPYYNGSKVTNYSASNPDATVYIAGDSSDGARGVTTSDVSSSMGSSAYVDAYYYRNENSSSSADITAMLIHVGEDKITTHFVYYETSSSAATAASVYEGSVTGQSNCYYGDTSYVYPSDHGYDPGAGTVDPNVPVAAKNYFSSANGGKYMYDTTSYPGGASYYTNAYYGDNSNQGGSYITGKLNDGVTPADSNPGSSNTNWSVFFNSTGVPQLTLQLPEAIYLNNISILYRAETGSYGNASIASLRVSENGSTYTTTSAYTTKVSGGGNATLTLQFNAAVKAKYITFTIPTPSAGTRVAVGEIQVWGDTSLPEGANPNMPAAAKNLAAASNGATYMYPTTIYPGGASYYSQAHYGDSSNQGGAYFAGKLNDGAIPADSNPGSSNVAWATWFSAHGTPEVTFKLSDTAYLNNLSLVYRTDVASSGFYGAVVPGTVQVSLDGTNFSNASDYTTKVSSVSGDTKKITVSFSSAYKAAYVKLTIAAPTDGGSRFAVGEVQIWGDTTLPEGAQVFELIDNSVHVMNDGYLKLKTLALNSASVSAQFKCDVTVLGPTGSALSSTSAIGTGCVVAQQDADGKTIQSVTVIITGDTNGDAQITVSDYIAISASVTGATTLGAAFNLAADVNADTSVGASDYLAIMAHITGAALLYK